jgi:hypothetical protein
VASRDDVRACRRALAEVKDEDMRERNALVWDAAKAAAEEEADVDKMARWLAGSVWQLGYVSALELLAAIGWLLIETEYPDGEVWRGR